ncbi:hypothetical protein LTT66_12655 [Nocardia gipuzkoensis]|nr:MULTISPECIES: hypothetical protein [Nocardia]UGT70935.1 hypothetical protein LTT66_12655 [Nocardia gipuzkoensis]
MLTLLAGSGDVGAEVDGVFGLLQIGIQQCVGGSGDGAAITQAHRLQTGGELVEVLVETGPHLAYPRRTGRAGVAGGPGALPPAREFVCLVQRQRAYPRRAKNRTHPGIRNRHNTGYP